MTTKWVCSNRMPMLDGSCECGHGPHVRVGSIITCDECNMERARRAYREAVPDDFDRRRFINRKDIDMSWGYEKIGTPDALAKDVTAYFDKTAEGYKGLPEADDVLACKARILALIAAMDLHDGQLPDAQCGLRQGERFALDGDQGARERQLLGAGQPGLAGALMKTRTIRGEEYRATVLKVTGRYPDGRPRDCILIHDDQETDVKDGTGWILVDDSGAP